MLTFLGIIVLVIVVHEMGHYLAARAMGVEVESFSVGFGKVLLKKAISSPEARMTTKTTRKTRNLFGASLAGSVRLFSLLDRLPTFYCHGRFTLP